MNKDIESILDLNGLRGSHLERFESVEGKNVYEAYGFLKDADIEGYKVFEIEDDEYKMLSSQCFYDSGYIPYRDGI